MQKISFLDPTANQALMEFILTVPDDQFYRRGQGSWLLRRALRNRLPESVLAGKRKGLQAADVGHRILRDRVRVRESLDSLYASAEARAMLDLPLMQSCLEELTVKVDWDSTRRAGSILLRGLGVGLFLRRLA